MNKRAKPWYRSRGVIGSIGSMLAATVTIAASLADWGGQLEAGVLGLVLGGVALWGRLVANAPIKLDTPKLPGILKRGGGEG